MRSSSSTIQFSLKVLRCFIIKVSVKLISYVSACMPGDMLSAFHFCTNSLGKSVFQSTKPACSMCSSVILLCLLQYSGNVLVLYVSMFLLL